MVNNSEFLTVTLLCVYAVSMEISQGCCIGTLLASACLLDLEETL